MSNLAFQTFGNGNIQPADPVSQIQSEIKTTHERMSGYAKSIGRMEGHREMYDAVRQTIPYKNESAEAYKSRLEYVLLDLRAERKELTS